MATGIAASVPEQHDQHDDKGDRTNGGADGDSGRRVGIAASLQVVPYLSDGDKNENEWPVGPENRNGIESWTPSAEQKESTAANEDSRDDAWGPPGSATLG